MHQLSNVQIFPWFSISVLLSFCSYLIVDLLFLVKIENSKRDLKNFVLRMYHKNKKKKQKKLIKKANLYILTTQSEIYSEPHCIQNQLIHLVELQLLKVLSQVDKIPWLFESKMRFLHTRQRSQWEITLLLTMEQSTALWEQITKLKASWWNKLLEMKMEGMHFKANNLWWLWEKLNLFIHRIHLKLNQFS